VRGTPESPGALLADTIGGLSVEEHCTSADQDGVDGVVVDDDEVGPVADAQMARVDAVPVYFPC
jgi:hypothetical protein